MMRFDRDYYENGEALGRSCYTDYRWMPELTMPLVHEIIVGMGIGYGDRILDFGCAKGFMVRAFREMGYLNTTGIDISEYAVGCADSPHVVRSTYQAIDGKHDIIIAKDVLEHMSEDEAVIALSYLTKALYPGGKILVVVPLGDGEAYNIPDMELDDTHVIRQPIAWWMKVMSEFLFIERSGYSLGATMKKRWIDKYPEGHGIIVGRKS